MLVSSSSHSSLRLDTVMTVAGSTTNALADLFGSFSRKSKDILGRQGKLRDEMQLATHQLVRHSYYLSGQSLFINECALFPQAVNIYSIVHDL